MFLPSLNGRVSGCVRYSLALLIVGTLVGTLTPAFCSAASTRSNEVSSAYKAERVDGFQLASYQDELLECSALAAIHMWIGDNLGDDSGAEIRKKLNDDYWINVSKGYLALAEEADGDVDRRGSLGDLV
jgi:hypothetical protein